MKIISLALLVSTPLIAGEVSSPDKSVFHLFNPTPHELMRELSTDRPDLTESPYTVDAGHVQVEMDMLNYVHDRHNTDHSNVRAESWSLGSLNLKLGLLNNVDLQLLVPVYERTREHDRATGSVFRKEGFGDLALRMKINLWGNDGGSTALALMPFVKIPTAGNDLGNGEVEGGLIIPFAAELPAGWNFGAMAELDISADSDNSGHHLEIITSATLGHSITENLGGYLELFSQVSAEDDADWIASFNCGLTYALTEDIQLDAGVNIGLTRAADDINPFVGLSFRF